MRDTHLSIVLSQIPKALFSVRERSSSAFVTTGVTYPNGVGVAVRVDLSPKNFIVSDDGYATRLAETMGAVPALNRIASGFVKRCGVAFERGTFFIADVAADNLAVAISTIANISARAMERVSAVMEQPRIKKSRALFNKRLEAAFGKKVRFDLEFKGATGKPWEFDAGVIENETIGRLYELVSPSTQAVAMANIKISDTQALLEAPHVTVALADYDATEPELRSILSAAGSTVIAASANVESYRINGGI